MTSTVLEFVHKEYFKITRSHLSYDKYCTCNVPLTECWTSCYVTTNDKKKNFSSCRPRCRLHFWKDPNPPMKRRETLSRRGQQRWQPCHNCQDPFFFGQTGTQKKRWVGWGKVGIFDRSCTRYVCSSSSVLQSNFYVGYNQQQTVDNIDGIWPSVWN